MQIPIAPRAIVFIAAVAVAAATAACGSVSTEPDGGVDGDGGVDAGGLDGDVDAPSNAAPLIVALSPPAATAGDASFTLTVQGNDFVPGSVVDWGGAVRPTTFVDASTLEIVVAASDVAAPGRVTVGVTNPAPGGGTATATFGVYRPFATDTWLADSIFKTAGDWFQVAEQPRIWVADFDADGIDDLVGVARDGDVWVSPGNGAGFGASTRVAQGTIFRTPNDWFSVASHRRVWVADVTGDGRADLVGVDSVGGIWVSESTGTTFNSSRMVLATELADANGYFDLADHEHVRLADMNADGKIDIVGIRPLNGAVVVATATGSATTASFTSSVFLSTSVLASANEWFLATAQPRLFLGDVTGDRRADIVAFDNNGGIWVGESNGTSVATPRRIAPSVFSNANGWFATTTQPRITLADVTGDGKLDVVGFGSSAVGDGDIWMLEAIGSGTSADFYQRILLDDSTFRVADGWFAAGRRPRVWVTDVTGDGRADVLGVDATGGVWVARAAAAVASPGAPAREHPLLLPAVRNGGSGLDAARFFALDSAPRVWLGDVTGDGVSDLVAISGAAGSDGDVLWRMSAPASVTSVGAVTRQMLASTSAQQVAVQLSRRLDPATFDPSTLLVTQNGTPLRPTSVATDARTARFTITFQAPAGASDAVDLAVAAHATDAWGHGIDGDGDGLPGGVATRPTRWSPSLVAGAARVSLMPLDASGIPRSSGFGYCPNASLPATPSTPANPIEARVLVIAGGGSCGPGVCASGQSCVAGQCQAGGVDANQPVVMASVDLIGFDKARLSELLAARYGIPRQNVIIGATHAHAAFRNIHLFVAPYFEERRAGATPYQSWVEDRLSDAVGQAFADLSPVELAVSSTSSTLGFNRHTVAPLSAQAETLTAIVLRTPGSPARTRAVLVNFALHPVIMTGAGGVNADFPGYLRQELESARCAAGDDGCAVLYFNAGAGDINPDNGTATDSGAMAQAAGVALAQAVEGMTYTFQPTTGAQVLLQRRVDSFLGTSACNVCGTTPTRVETDVIWGVETTAAAIGVPGAPLVRFATLPGEPFSGLQTALMTGLTPAPILLGYTNGYVGYLPDRGAVAMGGYGVGMCTGGSQTGPTFFGSSSAAPTNGDNLVTALRAAIVNDLD